MPHSNLEITANRTTINVVRPPFCVQKNQQTAPGFLCKPLLENHAKICLSLCVESAVQICSTAALECVPSCCLLLLPAKKSLLLSFSQSAHERIESNVIFSSFSSLNITPSDFWVIQVTFG